MLRPWNLEITLKRDGITGLHIQIVQALIAEIRRGRLGLGTPMPGTRDLAKRLAVNRKTVVQAYEELIAQGWLMAQGRRGTFVAAAFPLAERKPPQRRADNTADGDPARAAGLETAGSGSAGPAAGETAWIDFSDGLPDARMIPYAALSRAFRHALLKTARSNRLGYGDPRGTPALRQSLAQMLNMERGLAYSTDRLCLVRGSQMGIFLAARVLIRPGDAAVFETLSYAPARETFRACGATIIEVGQDRHGLIPAQLEALCRLHRVRAVYVTPHHQYPTTVMMPADRRMQLLALAEQYGFTIVEDDYDHEFHFDHLPILPIASLDRADRVIYVGSLSKCLAPGLRIGYIAAPAALVDRCAALIMGIDRQGNAITELAINELMASGELKRHLRRALRVYAGRRDAALCTLGEQLSGLATFSPPAGGLAIWLRLAATVDGNALCEQAAARQLRLVPPAQYAAGQLALAGLRIGYANLDEATFRQGVARLRPALQQAIGTPGG